MGIEIDFSYEGVSMSFKRATWARLGKAQISEKRSKSHDHCTADFNCCVFRGVEVEGPPVGLLRGLSVGIVRDGPVLGAVNVTLSSSGGDDVTGFLIWKFSGCEYF